jgi:hypothetical protein
MCPSHIAKKWAREAIRTIPHVSTFLIEDRMGRKMLVVLMMQGKFSGEGLQSLDADEDLMSAMTRELVEKAGVGETADAIWQQLDEQRSCQMEHDTSGLIAHRTEATDNNDSLAGLSPLIITLHASNPLDYSDSLLVLLPTKPTCSYG